MKVLAITNHQDHYEELFKQLPQDMEVIVVGSLLECLEMLNFHNPNIIVVALQDEVDDSSILAMLPQKSDDDYIPFIIAGKANAIDKAETVCQPITALIPPFSVHSLASKIYLHRKRNVGDSVGNDASQFKS